MPFGVGAIEGSAARPLPVLEAGAAAPSTANGNGNGNGSTPAYGPGEEPRPRDGEPTAAAHGEML